MGRERGELRWLFYSCVTVGVQGYSVFTICIIVSLHKPAALYNGKNKYDIKYNSVPFSVKQLVLITYCKLPILYILHSSFRTIWEVTLKNLKSLWTSFNRYVCTMHITDLWMGRVLTQVSSRLQASGKLGQARWGQVSLIQVYPSQSWRHRHSDISIRHSDIFRHQ